MKIFNESITHKDGLMYYYYNNEVSKVRSIINKEIHSIQSYYEKQINNGGDLSEVIKEMQDFYNQVRQMCYFLVEKTSMSKYDEDFLKAILDSELNLIKVDIDYINKKLENK